MPDEELKIVQPQHIPTQARDRFGERRERLAMMNKMAGMFSSVCDTNQTDYDELLKAYNDKCDECETYKDEIMRLRERIAQLEQRKDVEDAEIENPLYRTDKMPYATCKKSFMEVIKTNRTKQAVLKEIFSPTCYYLNVKPYTDKELAEVLNGEQEEFKFTYSDISKARRAS